MLPEELGQAKAQGEGGGKDQPGIGHQAVVVKEDADTVGFVLWQHLLGAPSLGPVFCFKTIIPDSQEHPLASSRAVPKAVLRWIRANATVGGGGGGASAASGDATWIHRFFSALNWSAAGGDFAAGASASTPVGSAGSYSWSSAQMTTDVQAWLDNPSSNFGWLLKGSEGSNTTAKRFDSSENASTINRPTLQVMFTAPTVPELSIANVSVDEGAGNASLTISSTLAPGADVMVNYSTSNGTAAAPGDYTATSNTATITGGTTSASITVPIVDDTLDELNETFSVALSNPTGGATLSGTANTATVTVEDNDLPPSITAETAVSVTEGDGGTTTTAQVTVSLSTTSGLNVTVDYGTVDGTATAADGDYTPPGSTLIIPASNVTGTVSVVVNGDDTFELAEAFDIVFSNGTTASTSTALTITQSTTRVAVLNDDPLPAVSAQASASVDEGDAGTTTTVDVLMTVSAAMPFEVGVDYATADGTATAGSDYVAVTGRATISAGNTTTTVVVTVLGDDAVEGNETFVIAWSSATTSATTTPLSFGNATTTITIIDDEDVVVVHVPLLPGFNLIGIPVIFETTTRARDVATALLPDGVDITQGPVASILKWDGSGYGSPWLRDFPDQPASNFEIEAGKGYFVRLLAPVEGNVWSVTGQPFASPVALDLAPGFNLVGVPFGTPPADYDSRSLATAMLPGGVDIADGPITSILRWDNGFTAWLSEFPDAPAGIFPIEPDRGYFLRATESVAGFLP